MDATEEPDRDGALEARLRRAAAEKSGRYERRTRHLDAAGEPVFVNRLILEDSPYLLQHAHNPVDWRAWGDAAFAAARRGDRPVFLSIGYSTCHWCHVMEEESFDNAEVAGVLNRHFVSVKMDREQFPDIDEIYMTGVQLLSGCGGWPMSSFLLPDGRPFFGATYFPPADFVRLLERIRQAWTENRGELERGAARVARAIDQVLSGGGEAGAATEGSAEAARREYLRREDRRFGGLAGAPKFPQEPVLLFMLDRAARRRDAAAMDFAARALRGMGRGGICDQVGGGFHRYSVDERWLAPHFEKMLYNQSQLAEAYLLAARLSGERFFRRVCERTLDYALREMQAPEGGFYSATDADSEGVEGRFFLWTPAQLREALPADEAEELIGALDVTEAGNFEGATILTLPAPPDGPERTGDGELIERLYRTFARLRGARERRPRPLRDDKLITAWNGAMAAVLARAGAELDRPDWIAAAEKAARRMLDRNVDGRGRLRRICLHGEASVDGLLEDSAHLIQALIALFDATGRAEWLARAVELAGRALDDFQDGDGGFFLSPPRGTGPRLTRSRCAADGATRSPAAVMLAALAALRDRRRRLGDDPDLRPLERGIDAALAALGGQAAASPAGHPGLLAAFAAIGEGGWEPVQYLGEGRLKAALRSEGGRRRRVVVDLDLVDGWHVAAPLELTVAPGETGWRLASVDYPTPSGKAEVDGRGGIVAYAGAARVEAVLERVAGPENSLSGSAAVVLRAQLCGDGACLPPRMLRFAA